MYRVALIGHQEITKVFLDGLAQETDIKVCLGVFLDPNGRIPSEYVDMRADYSQLGIRHHLVRDYSLKSEALCEVLDEMSIDVIFVVGWSRLIPSNLVGRYLFIGWHGGVYPPPRCRGRAGINWALINRHNSFFYYTLLLDDGVDTGKILQRHQMRIEPMDTSRTLYLKLGFNLVKLFARSLPVKSNECLWVGVNMDNPTELPKRGPEDSLINWNQSDADIDYFVRALSSPYPNAYALMEGGERIVVHSGRVLGEIPGISLGVGEIYARLSWGGLLVGCGSGHYLIESFTAKYSSLDLHGRHLHGAANCGNASINY